MQNGATLIYDRRTQQVQEESVFEDRWLSFFYGTAGGILLSEALLKRRWFSNAYAWSKRTSRSRRLVAKLVAQHSIDVTELDRPLDSYATFNDFFVRTLKPGARPIDAHADVLISPADARLLAYDLEDDTVGPVKGRRFSLAELCEDARAIVPFRGGIVLIFRLAPADYHRFGYIDEGVQSPIRRAGSFLHSVHPRSLASMRRVFSENVREWCILETKAFGPVLHVDVGALAVGRIVQHRRGRAPIRRGAEKGYFELGGSTIVLVTRPGVIAVDEDIASQSRRGIETLVRYGERVALRKKVSS